MHNIEGNALESTERQRFSQAAKECENHLLVAGNCATLKRLHKYTVLAHTGRQFPGRYRDASPRFYTVQPKVVTSCSSLSLGCVTKAAHQTQQYC